MTITSATLTDIGNGAGAGPEVMQYLDARGIRTAPTLALIASDADAFEKTVVMPLLSGFSKGGVNIKLTEEEKPIAKAVLLRMWAESKLQWQQRNSSAPAPATSTPTPATLTSASAATVPGASSSGNDKPPKTLPPQIWNQQIQKYNAILVGTRPRRFPEMEILGTESILARIHFEHVTSKQYTPVGLGELLAKRSFAAGGEINPLSRNPRKSGTIYIEDEKLVQDDTEKPWQPRSVLAVMDGANAIRWAWVLLELGEEDQIHDYIDWFIGKARSRPQRLDQLRQFWDAASWKMCMRMRSGKLFGEAASIIMSDVDTFHEYMAKEPVHDPKASATKNNQKRKLQHRPKDDDQDRPAQRPRQQYQQSPTSRGPRQQWPKRQWPDSKWNTWTNDKDKGKQSDKPEANVDTARALADTILEQDPLALKKIVATAGPPCPDFSQITNKSEGRTGVEGSKFVQLCDFLQALTEFLPKHVITFAIENVVMNDTSDSNYFSDRLGVRPIVLDGGDMKLVSRPRLWWMPLDWATIKLNPLTGDALQWTQFNRHKKLRLGLPPQRVDQLDSRGYKLHPDVSSGCKLVPCFTTPSPSSSGRDAPRRQRGSVPEQAKQRWLADNRQFAPWQYSDEAQAWKGGEPCNMPIHMKEQLHNFPADFTAAPKVPTQARHRMLANSWHFTVALMVMALLLTNLPKGAQAAAVPREPQLSAIQRVIQAGNALQMRPGPGQWTAKGHSFPPVQDMWQHWHMSHQMEHHCMTKPKLEPGILATLAAHRVLRHELHDLRLAVLEEIENLILEYEDETKSWLDSLHPTIQQVYTANGSKKVTQIPVMLKLLADGGFDAVDELRQDLTQGFPMTGKLHSGCGWMPRTDSRYSTPLPISQFKVMNRDYVRKSLQRKKACPHWQELLAELLKEVDTGKVSGPYHLPEHWHACAAEVSAIQPTAWRKRKNRAKQIAVSSYFDHHEGAVRREAISVIRHFARRGDAHVVPKLVGALADSELSVRMAATDALRTDPRASVRKAAINAVEKIASSDVVLQGLIFNRLDDAATSVRSAAILAAGRICNPQDQAIARKLASFIEGSDQPSQVAAQQALGQLLQRGSRAPLPVLQELLWHHSPQVRESANAALDRLPRKMQRAADDSLVSRPLPLRLDIPNEAEQVEQVVSMQVASFLSSPSRGVYQALSQRSLSQRSLKSATLSRGSRENQKTEEPRGLPREKSRSLSRKSRQREPLSFSGGTRRQVSQERQKQRTTPADLFHLAHSAVKPFLCEAVNRVAQMAMIAPQMRPFPSFVPPGYPMASMGPMGPMMPAMQTYGVPFPQESAMMAQPLMGTLRGLPQAQQMHPLMQTQQMARL
eukprot:Skav233012  [mRNA]  locus=scaffold909:68906:88437:+ [translate_table: standard]